MCSAQTRHCQSPEPSNKIKPCNRCSVQNDLLNLVQSSPKIQANDQHAAPDLHSKTKVSSTACYKRTARRKTSVLVLY